jgi:two-component system OmpR family response regulator
MSPGRNLPIDECNESPSHGSIAARHDKPTDGDIAPMRVLVIEDEVRIAAFIKNGLQQAGFVVTVCTDGAEGLAMARTGLHDLLVLDIMLEGIDGITVLETLRKESNRVPVILLTALGAVEDRVRGLNAGADDYLTKPFYVEELAARLKALARRGAGTIEPASIGSMTLNTVRREVLVGGRKLDLTAREYNLLEFLCRTPGNVYTRNQILECVWEYHFDPKTNIIDVYIQRLRSKLAEAGEPDLIETVRGVGYRIRPSGPG